MAPLFWFWLLLSLLCAFLVFLLPAVYGRGIYIHYRGARAVSCPETHRQVAVSFDALHAAISGVYKEPDLRLSKCTLWPQHVYCEQECIPEAARTLPYTRGEVEPPRTKKIYHVPVLIASSVSWLVGAVWHSQYLFRPQWMNVLGLGRSELRQIVHWWSPHLLSVAACLLFAYGVAWLLVWGKGFGVWRGIRASTILWLALALVSLVAVDLSKLSREMLSLELGYTILASLAVGTIIGGLSGKLNTALVGTQNHSFAESNRKEEP